VIYRIYSYLKEGIGMSWDWPVDL